MAPDDSERRFRRFVETAKRAAATGGLPDARAACEEALAIDPDNAEAHFQLGQVLAKLGDDAEAIRHLDRAAELKPGEGEVWTVYAEAVRRMGDPRRANAFLRRAVSAGLPRDLVERYRAALKPRKKKSSSTSAGAAPREEIRRAIKLLDSGCAPEAVQVAERLREAHPEVAVVANVLAGALAAAGKLDRAEKHYRDGLLLDPNYAELRANFGRFLLERGRADEAMEMLRAALKLAPDMPAALAHLGIALHRAGKARQAIRALEKSLAGDGGRVEPRLALARACLDEECFAEAERAVAPLVRLPAGQSVPDARNIVYLAKALAGQGRQREAAVRFDEAIAAAPGSVLPLVAKAEFLRAEGAFDEASGILREAIGRSPEDGELYHELVTGLRVEPDDPAIERMQSLWEKDDLPRQGRIKLGFALAKAMEDTGAHDRVFAYLRPANELVREAFPFRFEDREAQVDALLAAQDGFDFEGFASSGEVSGEAPIFVTGLPRSGTTLVEQVVASHSSVAGGGELGFVRDEWHELLAKPGGGFRPLGGIEPEEIAALGRRVAARMREGRDPAARVTDKGVQNYLVLGAIRLALPNARIVVVRRDPRDTLLSMYRNLFGNGQHLYSYDLRDLARLYRQFEKVIAFWRTRVPGWFFEIRYEDLVAEPEREARALIDACGLDWEDGCLEFHKTKRAVRTLSARQVRQPLYSSSVAAWRRHESELREMLDELGDLSDAA